MRDKIKKGFVNLSVRQIAGMVISAAGSIFLARLLGLEIFGLYAVSSFFVLFFGNFVNFGVTTFLIRKEGELSNDYVRTGLTLIIINGVVFLCLMFFVLAPLLSVWYGKKELYWLLSLSSIGVFISSVFRISQGLLERDMEYGKVSMIELTCIVAFYVPAVIAANAGWGIFAIVIGEICRGLGSSVGFVLKPFDLKLSLRKKRFMEIAKFGFSHTTAMLPWSINGAINPVIVARIAGIEATGMIRLAEGIVSQLSFFTAISNRISYPVFSKFQEERDRIIRAVEKGRVYQFLLTCLPLFIFSAFSYKLVPLLYGQQWYPVTNVLILMCFAFGVNTIFGLYSSSLTTIGKNWDIAKFTIANSLLLWLVSPLTVYLWGYLGLPMAGILITPSYYIMHKYFTKRFGRPRYSDIVTLLIVCYTIAVITWSVKNIYLSVVLFMLLSSIYAIVSSGLRDHLKDLFSFIMTRETHLRSPD